MTQSFDINEYNSRECEIHNHGFNLGAQSKQAEIDEYKEVAESMEDSYLREKAKVDELRKLIDEVNHQLTIIKNSDFRPHHHEYDKGWRDCAIAVLDGLKGTTNE